MMVLVVIALAALFYFTVSYFAEKRKSGKLGRAKACSVENADGLSMVYGKIGSDKVMQGLYSGDDCVYCSLLIEYRHETPKKLEWLTLYEDEKYVPFYITDEGGEKLSINAAEADFDLYANVNDEFPNIKDNSPAERKVKAFISRDKDYCLKNPVRIKERILRRDDMITVVSNVKKEAHDEFIAEKKKIVQEIKEICQENNVAFDDLPGMYSDASAPFVKYTAKIDDEKFYVSDDAPDVLVRSVKKKIRINMAGMIVSAAALVILACVKYVT